MRTKSHVGKCNITIGLTNTEGQVNPDIGRIGKIEGERGHDPEIRRASIQLDGECLTTKCNVRSVL